MTTPQEIIERRARRRAQLRRRRIIALVVLGAAIMAAVAFGVLAVKRMGDGGSPAVAQAPGPAETRQSSESPSASAEAGGISPGATAASSASATASASATPSTTPTAYVVGGPAPRPKIVKDYIDFNARRKAEMGSYSLDHYGSSSIELDPKVIVLHYTCGSDYESAHATFESDAPNMGVKPGVVAQFVIDKDGTIYQQIPLRFAGRHTVGLNYVAYGIECVQECPSGDAQAVGEIMRRKPQARALVALVRWLMYRDHISLQNVIGHGTANDSPYYKDLRGWKNDHTDWSGPQIKRLREAVRSD